MKNGNAAANRFGCGAMEKPKNLKLKFMKKEITKFLSANRISLAFIALTLPWAGVKSQEQTDGVPWTGEALPAESGEYYLYNKAGDGFLLGANTWGTQASLGQPGLLCTVTAVGEGTYTIKTLTTSNEGKNYLGSNGYVDAGSCNFTFTDDTPDDGLNEYTIKNGSNTLYYPGSGTVLKLDNGGAERAGQWLLVSKQQRIDSLENATADNGVDATFYIVGAGFDRGQTSNWKETHNGGNLTIIGPDRGTGSSNSCAYVKDNNESFDIYQELTEIPNGRYIVSCQGYYRPGISVVENGAQNAILYANNYTAPLQLLHDDGQGVPGNETDAANVFLNGRYGGNEVEVIVSDNTLRLGVRKDVSIANDFTAFDNFRLTYYGEVDESEAFQTALANLYELQQAFSEFGATAIAAQLQATYDQYKETTGDYAAAEAAIWENINAATAVQTITATLSSAITAANALLAQVENGTYTLSEAGKTALDQNKTAAQQVLAETEMAQMSAKAPDATEGVTQATINAQSYVDLCYTLVKAKDLADAIEGLAEEAAYQQVITDLAAASLDYATVASHVTALNAVSRSAMTPEFLAQASSESPIDFTSFIKNPNVYQTGESTQAANDWSCNKGSADGGVYTNGTLNTELYCYSWTGWRIKESQYSQQLSDLPDGAYKLEAATCTNFGSGNIYLYASIDNANILWNTNFNNNENTYNEACADLATTTSLTFVVQGGNIHIGVIGNKDTGAQGKGSWWKADNFRLYYIGTPEDLDITVSDAGYATYYAPNAFTMPEGLTGGIAKSVDTDANKLTIDWCYQPGSTVPGLTGIILQGKQGEYKGVYAEAVPAPEGNLLQGTLAAKNIAEAGYLYYKLANDPENGIGFYWDAAEGTSINNGANKAYLAIEQTPEASETNFFLWDWEATGIAETVADEAAPVDVYTLSGLRVRTQVAPAEALHGLQKGIYIVNGKKVIK